MKPLLVIAAIAAIFSLIESKPSGSGFGDAQLITACKVVFANGTRRTSDCFTANGLFACQKINNADFRRLPQPVENITAISLCLPVPCRSNSDCSGIDNKSTCVRGIHRRDQTRTDEANALRESCTAGNPESDSHGASYGQGIALKAGTTIPTFVKRKRCSIPPSYSLISEACRVVDADGSNLKTKECTAKSGKTLRCVTSSACQVPYQGRDVKLHFCENSKEPETPQAGSVSVVFTKCVLLAFFPICMHTELTLPTGTHITYAWIFGK